MNASTIVDAIVASTTTPVAGVAAQIIKEAYNNFRILLLRRFGGQGDLKDALEKVESKPDSAARRAMLREELENLNAVEDTEVLAKAQELLHLLQTQGGVSGVAYQATLKGSGAITQGERSVAAGKRGVAVGGNVSGGVIITGNRNVMGLQSHEDRPATDVNHPQMNAPTVPIKILFLAANPNDTNPLRLDEEIRAIDQALRQAAFRDRFTIQQHWAVRIQELQALILRHQPEIVHFSGHGSNTGELIFLDDTGQAVSAPIDALGALFSVLKDNIRCVLLNACFSQIQAAAIAQHIPYVIGISGEIGDTAALRFATAFYQALGYGRDVKSAFDLGCTQIDLENLTQTARPQLLTKNEQ